MRGIKECGIDEIYQRQDTGDEDSTTQLTLCCWAVPWKRSSVFWKCSVTTREKLCLLVRTTGTPAGARPAQL